MHYGSIEKPSTERLAKEVARHKGMHLACRLCGADDAPIVGVVFLDPEWYKRMRVPEWPIAYVLLSLCGNCLMRPDLNQAEDEVVAKSIRILSGEST